MLGLSLQSEIDGDIDGGRAFGTMGRWRPRYRVQLSGTMLEPRRHLAA